jgi:hypothetical protein
MARSVPPLDKLYTAAPADFVRTRNAVAKKLAEAGDPRRAAEVKRLRRPTVPVWALNQAARQDPSTMASFAHAVQALNKAQRAGRDVPAAMEAERKARQRVVERADAAISGAALRATPDVGRRMSNTLLAAATDAHLRDRLVRGELDEELSPAGFDLFEGASPAPARRAGATTDPKQLEAVQRAEDQARQLERLARERRDQAETAKKKKATLSRELRALEREARRHADAAAAADKAASAARRRLNTTRGRRGR